MSGDVTAVRAVLQKFQDAYGARDLTQLDAFMDLIVRGDDAELIGIGASERGGSEWFQGREAIRDIVASDWTYWGDVVLDVPSAKITLNGETAWLSTTGAVVQVETFDAAMPQYLRQMADLLDEHDVDPDDRLMEATHFGLRRLRERFKGQGHAWPLVFTAVLVRERANWRIHTMHWSMPVD